MPWRERMREAMVAAGKRRQDSSDVDDDQQPPVDTGNEPSTSSSVQRGTVSPSHAWSSASGAADSPESCTEAQESSLRAQFLQVFTGRVQQAGLNSRAEVESERSTSMDSVKCIVSDSTRSSFSDSNTDRSVTGPCPSAEGMESCSDFSNSLQENGLIQEGSDLPLEIQFSADSARLAKTDKDEDFRDARKTEINEKMQQGLVDTQKTTTTSIHDVKSNILYPVDSPKTLADRIDRAQRCCSAMRSDISKLSARCDILFSQLKTTRTHLASVPWRQKSLTADRVKSVSVAVDVKEMSCWRFSLSSVPTSTLSLSSAALPVKPESKCHGFVEIPCPRTSLSIIECIEEDLSFRLDQLTAYVSSSEMHVEQTQGDIRAGKCSHFTEGILSSQSSEPVLSSSTGKDIDMMRGGDVFIKSTSVMLTPPTSDESSSQNEDDDLDIRQRLEIQIANPTLTPWNSPIDFTSATPVLDDQSLESDCRTPDIEALTCLESFSDSGRLKLSLPIADQQSLQSSTMILTPPLSDQSGESEGQNGCTNISHSVPTSQATQPSINVPGQNACNSEGSPYSSECSESDWKDYYTESYWTCSSNFSDNQESFDAAGGQANDFSVEKTSTVPVLQKETRNPCGRNSTSNRNLASFVAKYGLDMAAEDGTQFLAGKPILKADAHSAVQQEMSPILPGLQNKLQDLEFNRNRCKDDIDDHLDLQKQSREQLKPSQKSFSDSSPEGNSMPDTSYDKVNWVCSDPLEIPKDPIGGDARQMLKSVPSRSTSTHKATDLISENRCSNRPGSTVDKEKAARPSREIMVTSDQLPHQSSLASCLVFLESHQVNTSNMDEIYSPTKRQNSATKENPVIVTEAGTETATKASSSERAAVSKDEPSYDQLQRISDCPATPQEQPPNGMSQAITSMAVTHSSRPTALPIDLEDLKPLCQWKLHQKRMRQHRSARHLQHLSMTQGRCWSLSQETEGMNQNSDDTKSVGQSYNIIERVSCGFNFLRQTPNQSCLPRVDFNNNIMVPVNIVFPQRTCSEILSRETKAVPGEDNKAYNLTASCSLASSKDYLATDGETCNVCEANIHSQQSLSFEQFVSCSDNSSTQLSKNCLVTMEDLKTGLYLMTEMHSTKVGVCVKQCTSGTENGATGSREYFTDTKSVWNKEHNCLRTEVALSARTQAQKEEAVPCIEKNSLRQSNTLSEVTYSMMDTHNQRILSCIVEVENETMDEGDRESSRDRNSDLPQVSDTAEEQTEEDCRGSKTKPVEAGIPRFHVRMEDFSLKNRPMSKVQEIVPERTAGEKYKLEQGSSDSKESKSLSDRRTDVQDNFACVSFNDPSCVLNVSHPAFYSRICEVLTSTPVVSNQKITRQQGNCIVYEFFNANQSMEQSCIMEMTENDHHATQSSQIQPRGVNGLSMHDSDVKNGLMVDCLRNVHHNCNSLGHLEKMLDIPIEEIDSSSVIFKPKDTMNNNGLAHTDIHSVSRATEAFFTRKGNEDKNHHPPQVTKQSDVGNFANTFVIAPQIPHRMDSAADAQVSHLEQFSCVKNGLTMGDQSSPLFMASSKGTESSCSRPQSNNGTVPGPCNSEPGERIESHPQVFSEGEEKAVSGVKTEANADSVTDRLLMKPRPKPLLPTPPYRRSPLSGGVPPCPHCLNHMLPGFPLAMPRTQCPQDCRCGYGEYGMQSPFSPMCQARWMSPAEFGYSSWSRAYNGPAATCVHHRGASQALMPSQSAVEHSDSKKRTVNRLRKTPQQNRDLKNTVCSSPKSLVQQKKSASQEKLLQHGKSDNHPTCQHTPAVQGTEAGVLRAQPQISEKEVKDVLQLLMLTWTLLLSSLNSVVHSKDADCSLADH